MRRPAALLALLAVVTSAPALDCQPARGAPPTRARVVAAARDIMRAAHYATFVTVGADGHPQARIVDPFPADSDLTLWVATNAGTRKVAQLARDPRVTLLYFEPANPGYVTVIGTATLVRDPAVRAKYWKEAWSPFYKDKHRGDDYLLIRITPRRLEVVSVRHGLAAEPRAWKPVVVELR